MSVRPVHARPASAGVFAKAAVLGSTLAGLAGLGACVAQPSSDAKEGASTRPADELETPKRCTAQPEQAVSVFAHEGCSMSVELEDGALLLRSQAEAAGAEIQARGAAPQACGEDLKLCTLEGFSTALGPVLFLAERGPESEVPVQIYIAWAVDGALLHAPSWHGIPSVVDHTRIGPPFALGPYDCGDGALTLLPTPRLVEAGGESVPGPLAALAGVWSAADAEASDATPPETPATVDPARCAALVAPLP